jgi:hypothetical protein
MRTAEAVQKARSIVDGLHTLASLSDEPMIGTLLDGVTVTTNGLALEVVAKLPVSQLAAMIQANHGPGKHGHGKHKHKDGGDKDKDSDKDTDKDSDN